MEMLKRAPGGLFALIPIGFLAIVATFLILGRSTGGPVESPYSGEVTALEASPSPIEDIDETTDPDGVGGDVFPKPSGPEYKDNEVIFEN